MKSRKLRRILSLLMIVFLMATSFHVNNRAALAQNDQSEEYHDLIDETDVKELDTHEEVPVEESEEILDTTSNETSVDEVEPTESETTETDPPEEKTFAVTLDSQGGTTFEPLVINEGDPIGQLPVPVKEGFGFDGWSLAIEGKLIDSSFIVNEDITLFAVWDWILVPNNPDGLSGPESVSAFI
ncbi:MAG TPA: InlB B-repeat-containing protein, partial [Erysipelothrix sp.]|nr:InlB B-repeat-containing protein [Erysipelothrix sp.]